MNFAELSRRTGTASSSPAEVLEAVQDIVHPDGRCLVTMGADGAFLVDAANRTVYHQPAMKIQPDAMSVGAGDVLYGCLLAEHLAGVDWGPALRRATERTARYLAGRGPPERTTVSQPVVRGVGNNAGTGHEVWWAE